MRRSFHPKSRSFQPVSRFVSRKVRAFCVLRVREQSANKQRTPFVRPSTPLGK